MPRAAGAAHWRICRGIAAPSDVATSCRIVAAELSPFSARISFKINSRFSRLKSTTSTTAILFESEITFASVGARSTYASAGAVRQTHITGTTISEFLIKNIRNSAM